MCDSKLNLITFVAPIIVGICIIKGHYFEWDQTISGTDRLVWAQ
jgi:hypothetical protein